MARQGLSKKLRFEVFKRDAFTCQYCGRKAPEIVLECDHVKPVADGGGNDILNLVTSCFDCNSGKGARSLSDQAALAKQVDQLAQLQERREQLEMMIEWRQGLGAIQADTIDAAADHWSQVTEDRVTLTKTGRDKLRKLIKDHGLDHILSSMSEAMDTYGRRDSEHIYTKESIDHAFSKLGGVARVLRDSIDKPYLKQLFYIRGILRKRLSYVDDRYALQLMERAVTFDVDLDSVQRLAQSARSWSAFRDDLERYIKSREAKE